MDQLSPGCSAQLRNRLPEMLSHAGAADMAETLSSELGAEIAEQVERHLQAIGELWL